MVFVCMLRGRVRLRRSWKEVIEYARYGVFIINGTFA